MLESSVLHHSSGGRGDSEVVGISWIAPTNAYPNPSLVVTCAHQVVVYKPGESRRTHQWSFKPSAATVLSHAAVFLPSGSRYVGVQQGSTLVSWRESELSVKRPLSSQAAGAVQAVHACPELGDYFVAVLGSGGVGLYHGGLERVAHMDAASEGGDKNSADSAARAKPKAVWSGVRGKKVVVLEIAGATERIRTFVLSLGSSSSHVATAAAAIGAGADSSANTTASVTLASSHILGKPPPLVRAAGGGAGESAADTETSACSAAFLGRGGGRGDIVMAVAWRTPYGPAWTKVAVHAGGAREEFARPVAATAAVVGAAVANGAADGGTHDAVAHSNGHKKTRSKSKESAAAKQLASGGAGRSIIPSVAVADGGRLVVHSGGASPRLALWDAKYGVLLEDDEAPETKEGAFDPSRSGKTAGIMVSGDGAYLALAVAGMVLTCPLPVSDAGTLASLLRRKRPSADAPGVGGAAAAVTRQAFPSVDLARSAQAVDILEHTGALEPGKWDADVISPFRDAETNIIRSLEDAARRKDGDFFERVLRQHLQQPAAGPRGLTGGTAGEGASGREEGHKRKRAGARNGSAGVVAAAVELCLANPDAELWGALSVLVKSGGVSARRHRELVGVVMEHAPSRLLEEVMLGVPDLPEADAVRILRHYLSQAAQLTVEADKASPALVASPATQPREEIDGAPPAAKRKRSFEMDDAAATRSSQENAAGKIVEVLQHPANQKLGDAEATGEKIKKKKRIEEPAVTAVVVETTSRKSHKGMNGTAIAGLSNGHAAGAISHEDVGGTSGDSGARSEGRGPEEGSATPGTTRDARAGKDGNQKKKRSRGGADSAETPASKAERGVRVALTLPHNEAFLRSALAGLSHGEAIVVLKVLTRLLSEGRTRELFAHGAKRKKGNVPAAARGLPYIRTVSVLGWAAAVLDSHFTRLAIGGAADAELVRALKALKKTTRREAECCELLCQVRSLVDEVERRHAAAAAEEARRRPRRELFSLRVLRF